MHSEFQVAFRAETGEGLELSDVCRVACNEGEFCVACKEGEFVPRGVHSEEDEFTVLTLACLASCTFTVRASSLQV